MQEIYRTLLDTVMGDIRRSNKDKRHPWRKAILTTVSLYPESRMVIKRRTDADLSSIIYTHSLSDKVAQIRADDRASLLLWHDKKSIQVRWEGHAELITEGEVYEDHLSRALHRPEDYLSEEMARLSVSERPEIKAEHLHFTLIRFVPVRMRILQLRREGHIEMEPDLNEVRAYD